jgi:hypothetical protein
LSLVAEEGGCNFSLNLNAKFEGAFFALRVAYDENTLGDASTMHPGDRIN